MQSQLAQKIIAAAALALVAGQAAAGTVSFTGSVAARGFAGPDPSCAPLPFRGNVPTGAAVSSLGNFDYTHSICLAGPVGPVDGSFLFHFGGGSLFGTITGSNAWSSTPMVADLTWAYQVTGGTGRFAGATGSFSGLGTSDGRTPPPIISLQFDGRVTAPGVPEPASWAILLAGFATVGTVLQRRRGTAGISPAC